MVPWLMLGLLLVAVWRQFERCVGVKVVALGCVITSSSFGLVGSKPGAQECNSTGWVNGSLGTIYLSPARFFQCTSLSLIHSPSLSSSTVSRLHSNSQPVLPL